MRTEFPLFERVMYLGSLVLSFLAPTALSWFFFSGAGTLRKLPGNATPSILGLLSRSFAEVNNVVALA